MSDEIVVRIRAEGQEQFIKDIKKAGVTVEQTGGKIEDTNKKAGKSFTSLGKTIGIAFATTAVIKFGKELSRVAVQIDATSAKTKKVFGSAAADIERFARKSATSLGLTTNEYKNAAAAAGDLLVPLGFTRKAAAETSAGLVDLSGALAAWTGGQKSAAEVSEILTKALLGEREQLKTLGINISEADVKGRLLEKGQAKLTGTALAQAKALSTLELITEKSADAQAAFADDTKTLAEQQLELSANIREFRDQLATALIPVLNKTIGFLNDAATATENFFAELRGDADLPDFAESISGADEYELKLKRLQATLELNTLREEENTTVGQAQLIALNSRIKAEENKIKIIDESIKALKEQKDGEDGLTTGLEEQKGIIERFGEELAELKKKRKEALTIGEISTLNQEIEAISQRIKDLTTIPTEAAEEAIVSLENFAFAVESVFATVAGKTEDYSKITTDEIDNILLAVAKLTAGGFLPPIDIEATKKANKEILDDTKKTAAEIRDERLDKAAQGISGIAQLQQGLTDGIIAGINLEIQELDKKYDQGLISEKEYQEQRKELLTKQAKADKANSIFSAITGTAAAIVQALNAPPPASFIFAAIAGAIGATQIATISAQPIPQFAKGTKGTRKAPAGMKWVGEEGPELIIDKGGYDIITNKDSEEMMRILAGYSIPVQFKTPVDERYKPMTAPYKLKESTTKADYSTIVNASERSRASLGKKLDRVNDNLERVQHGLTRRMTRA